MIIDNTGYLNHKVTCSTCSKEYIPSDDKEIKIQLNVPPIYANAFCSRKCLYAYQEFLETNDHKNKAPASND